MPCGSRRFDPGEFQVRITVGETGPPRRGAVQVSERPAMYAVSSGVDLVQPVGPRHDRELGIDEPLLVQTPFILDYVEISGIEQPVYQLSVYHLPGRSAAVARVDPVSGGYDSVQIATPAGLATGNDRDTVRAEGVFASILIGVVVGKCAQYGVQLIEIGGNRHAEIAQPISTYQQGMLREPTIEARGYGIDLTVIQWLVPLFVVGPRRQDVLAILRKQIVQRHEHGIFPRSAGHP